MKELYTDLFNYTTTNSDNIYIYYTQTLQHRHYAQDPFTTNNKYIFSNMKALGSWDDRDKRYFDFKDKYNISSIYSALIEKDNCYIVITNYNQNYLKLNSIIQFLNDHYTNKKIDHKEIQNINNIIYIYKLYTID